MTGLTEFLLHVGLKPDDCVSLFATPPGKGQKPAVATLCRVDRIAATVARDVQRGLNWWVGSNPMAVQLPRQNPDGTTWYQRRGEASDVLGVRALVTDIDVKDGGAPSVEAAHQLVDRVSAALGTAPSAIVESGHGLQPWWPIVPWEWQLADGASRDAAAEHLQRFHALVTREAAQLGFGVDAVFGLERVWRIPGMINWKDPAAPVETRVLYPPAGSPPPRPVAWQTLGQQAPLPAAGNRSVSDRGEPPADSRPPSSPEAQAAAWQDVVEWHASLPEQAATHQFNHALFELERRLGRWVATAGYADVDAAKTLVFEQACRLLAEHPSPLVTAPDDTDLNTLAIHNGTIAGLRRGPWDVNAPSSDFLMPDGWGMNRTPFAQPAPVTNETVSFFLDRFLSTDQLRRLPKPEPLIDGWLQQAGFAMVYGEGGAMKSFEVLNMLACISNGKEWHGHRVVQGNSLYVAAESSAEILERLEAWQSYHKADPRIMVYPESFDIFGGELLPPFIEALKQADVKVVAFDTLNRSTPGMEENTSRDGGRVLANIEQLQRAGIAVIVVHHTSRGGSKPRGTTAIEYGSNHGIFVERNGTTVTVRNDRQKRWPEGQTIALTVQLVEESLVLVQPEAPQLGETAVPRTDTVAAAILRFMAELPGEETMTAVLTGRLGSGSGKKSERVEAFKRLVELGHIERRGAVESVNTSGRGVQVDRFVITESGRGAAGLIATVAAPVHPSLLGAVPNFAQQPSGLDSSPPSFGAKTEQLTPFTEPTELRDGTGSRYEIGRNRHPQIPVPWIMNSEPAGMSDQRQREEPRSVPP